MDSEKRVDDDSASTHCYAVLPFEVLLECCGLHEIRMVPNGPGWVGTRYAVKLNMERESHPLRDMHEVRRWVIQRRSAVIRQRVLNRHPEFLEAFDIERDQSA